MKIANIYKRVMALLLVLTLSFGGSWVPVSAAVEEGTNIKTEGNYQYQILPDENTIEILTYTGQETSVTIPAMLGGKNVVKIGAYAFANCKAQSLVMPQTVTHIDEFAFYSAQIPKITLSKNLKYIGERAFIECNTRSINIPNSVEEIGKWAFMGCRMEELVYAAKAKTVGAYAFDSCERLKKIEISEGVTYIAEGMFSNCYNFSSLILPKSVKYIGPDAFSLTDRHSAIYVTNKNCEIYDAPDTINGIVCGKKDSTAEAYAKKYKKDFFSIKPPTYTEIKSVRGNKDNLTLKWTKSKKAKGYQIQYSTSIYFAKAKTKTLNVKKNKVSEKLSGLKANKKYYIRIRAYKNNLYSSWSDSYIVTVK